MQKMLDANIQKQVRDVFKEMQQPVAVLFFGSSTQDCELCEQTRQLMEEIIPLSEKLSLEVYDLEKDAEIAAKFHVDKAPGIVLAGKGEAELVDFGVRYAGIPAGHEFSSFIHDLVLVSKRDSGLSQETRDFLSSLKEPVSLQVFVTPT